MRLWDANSGQQIGGPIPHQLREDTIIQPAVNPTGKFIATRASKWIREEIDMSPTQREYN
jgi:hypothetical protein